MNSVFVFRVVMVRSDRFVVVMLVVGVLVSGCFTPNDLNVEEAGVDERVPFLGYTPATPDGDLPLVSSSHLLPGYGGTEIQVRIVRPAEGGPFPVVTQFTPYTAPGRNVHVDALVEPVVGATQENFVEQFVRRGYVYAHADVRGTGDSSGCLDLRGDLDIQDAWHLAEWLGTQDWSNGNVGFIGASYPGSESHIAAISGNEHVKAVVPVVASTSFYHYHHNSGVPYRGQHSLGGTNSGYTTTALNPTVNPQHPNFLLKYIEQVGCNHVENMLDHGGMDQTGAYYGWWHERNLRWRVDRVEVPVLMAQGLQDWNVKPDHIAEYFNDLDTRKVLVATQKGHAWPDDADSAYGKWWEYVVSFFDTFLKEVDTGMFTENVAWVHDDSEETWHRSENWPLLPAEREEIRLNLTTDGRLAGEASAEGMMGWLGCPRDTWNMGQGTLATVEHATNDCTEATAGELQMVFTSEPFTERVILSGVPQVTLELTSEVSFTHLVAQLERVRGAEQERINYGYLNPTYREGLDHPVAVRPGEAYTVTIDLYPQEDVIEAGDVLVLTLRSHDNGRTIEAFERGENTVHLGPEAENMLMLPLRPEALQGTRLG